jgi:hypothetical protein
MFFYTVDYTIRILEIIVKINKKTTQSATAKSPTDLKIQIFEKTKSVKNRKSLPQSRRLC